MRLMTRVIFMGTPEFAVPTMRTLHDTFGLVAAYTRPDAASGRGSAARPTPVKTAALELGVPVMQPTSLRDPSSVEALRELEPDIIVVAAYGAILPPSVLEIPPHGCVNVHASLLPRWRGAAPIQRAILEGDKLAGVCIMRMEEGLDTGPYCSCASTRVGDHTSDSLTALLADMGAELIGKTLPSVIDGTAVWTEQDESLVTYAEKILKSNVALDPSLEADALLRRVRAASRQAPARASIGGRGVTVMEARASDVSVSPGTYEPSRDGVILGAADGAILVTSLKPDGKSQMDAAAWVRGLRDQDRDWGSAS